MNASPTAPRLAVAIACVVVPRPSVRDSTPAVAMFAVTAAEPNCSRSAPFCTLPLIEYVTSAIIHLQPRGSAEERTKIDFAVDSSLKDVGQLPRRLQRAVAVECNRIDARDLFFALRVNHEGPLFG
jgi:hypothetical protein